MRLLYYNCPIEAVYMAKYFGVRYSNIPAYDLVIDGAGELINTFPERLYIHPESLHQFEPQIGDKDEDGYIFNSDGYWERYYWYRDEFGENKRCQQLKMRPEGMTAKRNGKLFIMPR